MNQLAQDVHFALRTLRRDLGFTAMIVLTLAIGIGLNTAVFSVVRSVLLEPLPYAEPGRLVVLWTEIPEQGVSEAASSYRNVQDWKQQSGTLEDLATFDPISLTVTDGEWPEQISAAKVSANFFSVLGVTPVIGRTFSLEEEQQRAPVVVLSHGLWQRRFNGSPDAIGRTMEIAGTPLQVIGIMPDRFEFQEGTQLWLPQTMFSDLEAMMAQRGTGPWHVIGRLRPGVALPQARDELNAIAAALAQQYPNENAGLSIRAVSLHDQVTGSSIQLALWTLFGAVALVLLIACGNGAHMMLARGMNRAQEFAIRNALGASARRLMRQALTESLIISVAAGMTGVLLAYAALRMLVALAPGNIPRLDQIGIDAGVLLFATVISMVVGLVFGVGPALGLSRSPTYQALRVGRGQTEGNRAQRARRFLIVFQFALAITLVFGASMLIQSLVKVGAVETGFQSRNVLMANLSVETPERRLPFYEQVVQDVRSLPGVVATGIVEDLFISGVPTRAITIDGRESPEPIVAELRIDAIAGEFFQTIGVPLREGRDFSPADRAESLPVAIINETMARRFWPGVSPVGMRFRTGDPQADAPWIEVVGVVGDMRRQGPERAPIPQAFRPYAQDPSRNMILLVRTDGPVPGLTASVRTRIAAIDRTVPLYMVTTLPEALDRYVSQRRFQTAMLGLFSAVALLLAALGIAGLVRYSVSRRTREIGVRIALGGSPGQVVTMFLRQGLSLAIPGLAAGLVCSLLLAELLSALFFGVAPLELTNILMPSAILLFTALLASYLPARRAGRIDPMTALRNS